MKTRATLLFALALPCAPGLLHAESGTAGPAAVIAARLGAPDPLALDGESLDGGPLRIVYAERGDMPLWVGTAAAAERVAVLAETLADAASHGLDPGDYHADAIARRRTATDAPTLGELDLLLTDGVMRWAIDVHAGRAAPASRNAEVDLVPRQLDPVPAVKDAAAATDLRAWLAQLPPPHPEYQQLRQLLATYRKVESDGGSSVPGKGPKLQPGVSDANVPAIRRRLSATGELPAGSDLDSRRYDDGLVEAVQTFQRRYGLTPDGVIGAGTRAALNVTARERTDQIIANLERWRWLPDDLGPRHVRVNIPAFWLAVVDHGRAVLEMPVVVGKPTWRTPILASAITQLNFNPNWTVPASIARKEMLHKARQNPGYFSGAGIHVLRGGRPINGSGVDWGSGIGGLTLRQPPGPGNPLGRVKFLFPNSNGVYLHDTSSKRTFQSQDRALSHGCVRVGKALDLAAYLLSELPEWTPQRQKALTATWRTQWISLPAPVPVYVLYQTAWLDEGGAEQFREDIYGRDVQLVEALRRKRSPRAGTPEQTALSEPPIS